MGKLVVLKLGDGNFEQGFGVTLQICEDGDRPSTEITGRLPPATEIPHKYSRWQVAYYNLGLRSRLEAAAVQVTNVSISDDCQIVAKELCQSLNAWLQSELFRPLREKLLEKLIQTDEVRVILQTENILLQRLPWHLCELFERYPKAEIALSAPAYERSTVQASAPHKGVRILAILGNSVGIDTQADAALLAQLPGATVKFLVEPQRQELSDRLWSQGWDILFFAGHSESLANGNGQISLNRTDSITINDLRFALQTAVEHGLKLAIFNSCDGLGLARDLAGLQIPQIIVMREPVPDSVAQEFLKNFLKAFAGGKSFYLAVREARQRLQGLEDKFPCASWLPVIYQNPAEVPLTWQQLSSRGDRQKLTRQRRLRFVLLASLMTTATVMGVRYLGLLQSLELQAFDDLTKLRPVEGPDPRLLIVKVTEADIQAQSHEPGQGSLSDRSLEKLLQKLEQYQPRTIGLDIYRPLPVEQNYTQLKTRLKQSDRFFAVCKVSDPVADDIGVAPPPEISKNYIGFSDVVADDHNIVRRQLINFTPPWTSSCTAEYSFSALLALHYLHTRGIEAKSTAEGNLQVGDVVLKKLRDRTGGYQILDDRGYQLLLNYRSFRALEDIAPQVTLKNILNDEIAPDLVKHLQNRLVLIGVTASSASDFWFTPYSTVQPAFGQQIPGVFLQAQMVSQILSAVLDKRPLIWVLPLWGELLWIWSWSLVGGIITWRWRSPVILGVVFAVTLGSLYGLCFAVLTQAGWLPLVPGVLALIVTAVSGLIYRSFSSNNKQLLKQ